MTRPRPQTPHDMYLPARRAKRCTPPRAVAPPKTTAHLGTQAEREEWMRQRQAKKRATAEYDLRRTIAQALEMPPPAKTRSRKEYDENQRLAIVEGQREAQLLAEAEAEIRRRRIAERGGD